MGLSRRTEKVILLFTKNVLGDRYIYAEPVVARGEYGKYIVTCGEHKGVGFNSTEVFDVERLYSKLHKQSPSIVSFPYPSRTKTVASLYGQNQYAPPFIGIVLDDAVEKEVYERFKNKTKKEPNSTEFVMELVSFGDCIGRNIDYIYNNGKGFDIHLLGDVLKQSSPGKELLKKVLVDKKQPAATMEASENRIKKDYSRPTTSISQETTYKKEIESDATIEDEDEYAYLDYVDSIDVNQLKEKLRKKIIGQDDTIDKVVNNIYFNQKYIDSMDSELLRHKANILLDGPTGSGKTFIIEEVAKELKLPIVVTPATNYSTVGYKGSDIVEVLEKLLKQAGGNLELAERGIVAFDEFDKLGNRNSSDELSMRKAIQQELLTFIGGTKINVSYNGKNYEFDTSRLTIIGLGAFTKLREDKIRENEKNHSFSIGFGSVENDSFERVYSITKEDYIQEGLERELVGRFSCIAHTNELSVDDLKRILLESISSPLIQIKSLGTIMKCKITIDEQIIDEIAQMAYDTNVGARGLIQIVQALKDVVSNDIIQRKDVVITKEHLEKAKLNHLRTYQDRGNRR